MKNFAGPVLFLDRSDINTDEIIPAKYLTEISKQALKPHLLEDLNLEEFIPGRDITGKTVIITRANFGCGSSREHAPWALEANGIHLVIGISFARIFRQNMFNCGMMAVELPAESIDHIFTVFGGRETVVETDFEESKITISTEGKEETIFYSLSDFDRALVKAGGWMEYADSKY
ncbi:MAG: 3-isopropylmalate dehydratase small subunit [Thermodesulfobacteriota bacterium]|nr:3-isopropylmalate dehydratase small subunit [Thermodesulfobacteriota bacterium]